jgi:hypothetical protein
MSRRVVVVGCLALGLAVAPGVALADPPWQVPDGRGDQVRGDVCTQRGEPPCHTTTTKPTTTTATTTTITATSTGGWSTSVTTTTGVSGTSATSATTTTTDVAGSTTGSTTTSTAGTTRGTGTTTSAAGATVPAGPPPAPRVMVAASADRGLAGTGAAPLWTGVGGLAALLSGAVLLVFSRRRRA